MTGAGAIIARARAAGATLTPRLWVEGKLPPELRAEIKIREMEVIAVLVQPDLIYPDGPDEPASVTLSCNLCGASSGPVLGGFNLGLWRCRECLP